MDTIYHLIPENILYALGWTVLHSLWQAFVVALLLAAFLLSLKKKNARLRYLAGFASLGIFLAVSIVTFILMLEDPVPEAAVIIPTGPAEAELFTNDQASSFLAYFDENLPLIVVAWFAGMVFFLLKLLGGLLYINHLKIRQLAVVPEDWHRVLDHLKKQIGWNGSVKLTASALVKVPMVVGWLKPVILMPVAALNQLTPQQVEAILAHELAHIARYDYLLNLLQSFIEIVFYFNPAVWWISARIRTERENCCDDIAVTLCGDSLTYAHALVSLQEMHYAAPAFAMPFAKNRHQLFHRIQRILQGSPKKSNAMEKLTATVLLLAAVLILSVQAKAPANDLTTGNELIENSEVAIVAPAFATVQLSSDTIPKNKKSGSVYWHSEEDGEEIQVRMKDGKIQHLEINGKEIPSSEYAEYQDLVEELMADLPEPPAIPGPPDLPPPPPMPDFDGEFPDLPAMPAPPAPPAPHFREALPAPPAPPAPSHHRRKIVTEKNGDGGTSVIIQSAGDEEPVVIEFKKGRNGSVIINGSEIRGMKAGDKAVIYEGSEKDQPDYFAIDGLGNQFQFAMPEGEITVPEIAFEEMPTFTFPPGSIIDWPESMVWEQKNHSGLLHFTPRNERQNETAALLQEFQDRMRDGNMSDEWLKEFHEKMRAANKEAELNKRAENGGSIMEGFINKMDAEKIENMKGELNLWQHHNEFNGESHLFEAMKAREKAQKLQMEELLLNREQSAKEKEMLMRELKEGSIFLQKLPKKEYTPDDGRM